MEWLAVFFIHVLNLNIHLTSEVHTGKERYEEAREIIIKYHANGDANHPIVKFEMDEMITSVQQQGLLTWRNYYDVRSLFKTRARRYRMMLYVPSTLLYNQIKGRKLMSL